MAERHPEREREENYHHTKMAAAESGSFSVMNNLFANGNFAHILLKIFLQLDGNSLNSALEVSRSWRRFVAGQIYAKDAIRAGLQLRFPDTLRISLF